MCLVSVKRKRKRDRGLARRSICDIIPRHRQGDNLYVYFYYYADRNTEVDVEWIEDWIDQDYNDAEREDH